MHNACMHSIKKKKLQRFHHVFQKATDIKDAQMQSDISISYRNNIMKIIYFQMYFVKTRN